MDSLRYGRDRCAALRLAWALLVAIAILLMGSQVAYAEPKVSDDGVDYGWLYRKGDQLLDIETDEVCYSYANGSWYIPQDLENVAFSEKIFSFAYSDGTLVLRNGSQVDLDVILRNPHSGKHIYQGKVGDLTREGVSPRLHFLKYYAHSGRYTARDITHLIIDDDTVACWGKDTPYPERLDGLLEGCSNLLDIRGLSNIPTDRVVSMARMFSGCSQLEELDMSGFDTSACTDFAGMFDGCLSLTTLVLGDGWTQEAARLAHGLPEDGLPDVNEPNGEGEGPAAAETRGGEVPSEQEGQPGEAGPAEGAGQASGNEGAESGEADNGGDTSSKDEVVPSETPDQNASDGQAEAPESGESAAQTSDDGASQPSEYVPQASDTSSESGEVGAATTPASANVVGGASLRNGASQAGAMRQATLSDGWGNAYVNGNKLVIDGDVDGDKLDLEDEYADVDEERQNLDLESGDESGEPSEPTASEAGLATFPVDMYGTHDGKTVLYQAGEVIPDGAGTYVVADRTHIKYADIRLSASGTAGDAVPSGTLTCEYTGEAVEPALMVFDDGNELVSGTDYTFEYVDNIETGTASVMVMGKGAYYGCTTVTFEIADTGAYAFLYADGRLYLKAGHELPSNTIISSSAKLKSSMRWFDSSTEGPGSTVPWASYAPQVKSVTFDPSFKTFKPTSAKAWFSGCTSLTTISGWENLDASCLTSMESMFAGCTSLTDLSMANVTSAKVTSFANFVKGCSKLETLDLGTIDAYGATNMKDFLSGCTKLKRLITARGWRNAKVASAKLIMPVETYQTTPVYKLYKQGAAVPNGAGTYQFRDLALSFAKVSMPTSTYTCTGKAIKPKLTVTLGGVTLREGTDYTITYANNVQTGNAKATVKGKGVFSGGLIVPFKIKARTIKVGDRLTYTNGQATYTFVVTKPNNKAATAEASIEVVNIKSTKLEALALPSQCTIGGVKVSLTSVSSKLRGSFRNVRTVIIGSNVTTIGAYAFKRTPKVRTVVLKTARIKHMGKCLKGSKVTLVQTKVRLSKTRQRNYKYWFTHYSFCGKSGVRYRYM